MSSAMEISIFWRGADVDDRWFLGSPPSGRLHEFGLGQLCDVVYKLGYILPKTRLQIIKRNMSVFYDVM